MNQEQIKKLKNEIGIVSIYFWLYIFFAMPIGLVGVAQSVSSKDPYWYVYLIMIIVGIIMMAIEFWVDSDGFEQPVNKYGWGYEE